MFIRYHTPLQTLSCSSSLRAHACDSSGSAIRSEKIRMSSFSRSKKCFALALCRASVRAVVAFCGCDVPTLCYVVRFVLFCGLGAPADAVEFLPGVGVTAAKISHSKITCLVPKNMGSVLKALRYIFSSYLFVASKSGCPDCPAV